MTDPVSIVCEAPRAMHAKHELTVLHAAMRGRTAPPALRSRMAVLLNQLDAFDKTIDLLTNVADNHLSYHEQMLLTAAYFAQPGAANTALAHRAAAAALALAVTDAEAAAALADQAKAYLRMGSSGEARILLYRALERDAANRNACKRLTVDLLLGGEPIAALELTDSLMKSGVDHSRLFAARATALAALGEVTAARELLDLDRLLWEGRIDPPAEWSDLAYFHTALTDELLSNSSLRYGRYGTASKQSWRIDSLGAGDAPLSRILIDRITATVQQRISALGGVDHPWVKATPRHAIIRSWCVITEASGHETWHMHPFGWMSGVYYVAVPELVAKLDSSNGCLMLGLSDGIIGAAAASAVGHHVVRPHIGSIAMFPSHSYHRTFPHGAQGKRVCVAFDVQPI